MHYSYRHVESQDKKGRCVRLFSYSKNKKIKVPFKKKHEGLLLIPPSPCSYSPPCVIHMQGLCIIASNYRKDKKTPIHDAEIHSHYRIRSFSSTMEPSTLRKSLLITPTNAY